MKTIKIAGVPEHFNAPWKYAIENGLFANAALSIEFIDYGTGTGAMCEDLTLNKIDMAVVLTEGIIKYQQIDPSVKIISQFVDTPLTWGIHVSNKAIFNNVSELQHARFAISRLGSGSHLMTYVLGKNYGWSLTPDQFIAVGGLEVLGQSILEKKADVFLWEVLTTKPVLERFQLRLLDTIPTPWPCFQIAVSAEFSKDTDIINSICKVIFSVGREFNANQKLATAVIKTHYGLKDPDILSWLKSVKWTEQTTVNNQLEALVLNFL